MTTNEDSAPAVRLNGLSEILVPSRIYWWILRLAFGGRSGSGFLVALNGEILIATAAHTVKAMREGDKLAIRRAGSWDYHDVSQVGFGLNGEDVAVIRLSVGWPGGIEEIDLSHGRIMLGQQVVYLGFPLGLEMDFGDDRNGFPYPLIKSGIFSGVRKLNGHNVELFDATNNVGFSGGPIVVRENLTGAAKLWGIVTGYEYDAPVPLLSLNEQRVEVPHPDFYVKGNSGFMRGYGLKSLREAASAIQPGT